MPGTPCHAGDTARPQYGTGRARLGPLATSICVRHISDTDMASLAACPYFLEYKLQFTFTKYKAQGPRFSILNPYKSVVLCLRTRKKNAFLKCKQNNLSSSYVHCLNTLKKKSFITKRYILQKIVLSHQVMLYP